MTASKLKFFSCAGPLTAFVFATLPLVRAAGVQARDPQYPYDGYSYLRIADSNGPFETELIMHNLNHNDRRHGIEMDALYVHLKHPTAKAQAADAKAVQKEIAVELPARSAGAGSIVFGKSADATSDRIEAAVKHQEVIKDAELLVYNEDTLVGRFVLRGIVFTKIEPIMASACPADAVTLAFRAIERE